MTPTAGSQLSRYVIPDELAPPGVCCVSVPVPDNPQWRALFLGALWRLTLQTHYERDTAKNGKVVAARWRQVYSEVRDSMGICTPSDTIIRSTINADFRLALNVEFTANGLDGIAPDRPDTFFDEDAGDTGAEVTQRTNALCNACIDFVNTIADDAANVALTAGLTVIPTLTPIVFAIAPIAGAILISGLALLTLAARLALNDEETRRKVACCMFDNLEGLAITEANFNASLTGCGFGALSQEEIVREIIEGGVNDRGDYLAFVSVLGSFFAAVGDTQIDCQCGLWTHTFDFEAENDGWTDRAEDTRPYGIYNAGIGWVSEFAGASESLENDERLYIQKKSFPSRTIIQIQIFYTTTGVAGGSSADSVIGLKLAGVLQEDEHFGNYSVPDTFVIQWDGSESCDEIEQSMTGDSSSDNSESIITKIVVTGEGTDPF